MDAPNIPMPGYCQVFSGGWTGIRTQPSKLSVKVGKDNPVVTINVEVEEEGLKRLTDHDIDDRYKKGRTSSWQTRH